MILVLLYDLSNRIQNNYTLQSFYLCQTMVFFLARFYEKERVARFTIAVGELIFKANKDVFAAAPQAKLVVTQVGKPLGGGFVKAQSLDLPPIFTSDDLPQQLKGVACDQCHGAALHAPAQSLGVRLQAFQLLLLLAFRAGSDVEQIHRPIRKGGAVKQMGSDQLMIHAGSAQFFLHIEEVAPVAVQIAVLAVQRFYHDFFHLPASFSASDRRIRMAMGLAYSSKKIATVPSVGT